MPSNSLNNDQTAGSSPDELPLCGNSRGGGACVLLEFGYNQSCIKKRPDGLTNLPPGKVDAKADAAPVGATNREMRRPSLDTLEGFFYV